MGWVKLENLQNISAFSEPLVNRYIIGRCLGFFFPTVILAAVIKLHMNAAFDFGMISDVTPNKNSFGDHRRWLLNENEKLESSDCVWHGSDLQMKREGEAPPSLQFGETAQQCLQGAR